MDDSWETTHLLLHLHAHHFLHLHELVWHHTVLELSVLWVLGTILVEHHLHIWVNVHTLGWHAHHLVVHHHSWELLHVLHMHAIHWVGLRYLVVSHLSTHWLATRLLAALSKISITMSI